MVRSAAARSLIGLVKVTVTGAATPTTSPPRGWTDATAVEVGDVTAAKLLPDTGMPSAAIAVATSRYRIALRTVPSHRPERTGRGWHTRLNADANTAAMIWPGVRDGQPNRPQPFRYSGAGQLTPFVKAGAAPPVMLLPRGLAA